MARQYVRPGTISQGYRSQSQSQGPSQGGTYGSLSYGLVPTPPRPISTLYGPRHPSQGVSSADRGVGVRQTHIRGGQPGQGQQEHRRKYPTGHLLESSSSPDPPQGSSVSHRRPRHAGLSLSLSPSPPSPSSKRRPAPPKPVDQWESLQRKSALLGVSTSLDPDAIRRGAPDAIPSQGRLLRAYNGLFEHQKEGVQWMYNLWRQGLPGGVLAHDMGLGKTVQISYLLRSLFSLSAVSHALIVVPSSLLHNWESELRKWCPGIPVCMFHGTNRDVDISTAMVKAQGIVLTSYGHLVTHLPRLVLPHHHTSTQTLPKWERLNRHNRMAKRKKEGLPPDPSDHRAHRQDTGSAIPTVHPSRQDEEAAMPPRDAYEWGVVICDEATRIKAHSALASVAIRMLKARLRVALSGTPVQNNLQELWCIVDWVTKGSVLGGLDAFCQTFDRPIIESRKKDASKESRYVGLAAQTKLNALTDPLMLRRSKEEVLGVAQSLAGGPSAAGHASIPSPMDTPPRVSGLTSTLPPKLDMVVWIPLSRLQLDLYNGLVGTEGVKSMLKGLGMKGEAKTHAMQGRLPLMSLLSKICDTPDILSAQDMSRWPLEQRQEIQRTLARLTQEQRSSKLMFTLKLCDQLCGPDRRHPQHKTLVFSQHTSTLDVIEAGLRGRGVRLCRIKSSMKVGERQAMVDAFNRPSSPTAVCLLTVGVGGMGLNITGADRVLLYDPAWNPSVENQAIDRAYRLGQKRPVVVYRLVTVSTIEEHRFVRQIFKSGLIEASVQKVTDTKRHFNDDDLTRIMRPVEDPYYVPRTAHALQRETGSVVDILQSDYAPMIPGIVAHVEGLMGPFDPEADPLCCMDRRMEGRGRKKGAVSVGTSNSAVAVSLVSQTVSLKEDPLESTLSRQERDALILKYGRQP
ncbi:hypothetical protein KIPB_001476 [Kipferlia bialata]|uniref:Uncharacterized protein n=1 Tax=Kipferlia bialata TaxID=797122 RepID=A0A9K3CQL9_9EUKA|nr:hypothetical protein KIPB_001476 [Kipferlia bialata]|eukprot:g1476.t1